VGNQPPGKKLNGGNLYHFKQWWKKKVWDSTTPDQLRVALKKFIILN
jgi:hypothetical protein